MSSIFQNLRNQALPVSQTQKKTTTRRRRRDYDDNNKKKGQDNDHHDTNQEGGAGGGIRRRLSSLSLKMQQPSSMISSGSAAWGASFGRRSKSVSEMGEYAGNSVRKWWDWGWGWILSRKPTFATDLEMNEEESILRGSQNKGSWRHVFFKARSELRRLLGSDNMTLPQTYHHSSFNSSQNGKRVS